MKTIEWWTIKAQWSDGTEELFSDIPDWVARSVDEWLNDVEQERSEDGNDIN